MEVDKPSSPSDKENVHYGKPASELPASVMKLHEDAEHYRVITRLGEGAYGDVMLVEDKRDLHLLAAMKVMYFNKFADAKKEGKKEALIQQMLSERGHHPNVIQFIGFRIEGDLMKLFIEYADGGELFDQIEPDKGVGSASKAQHYFRQLVDGISFVHGHGVCHRDIKPENLFLTKLDILKIGDFGLATVFRHNGKERMLTMSCGTRPYASPELLEGKYLAQPADLWSCGVVLVTMLTGELPWQSPSNDDKKFSNWMSRAVGIQEQRPWNKVDSSATSLLKSILTGELHRATVERILQHPWCTTNLNDPLPNKRKRMDCVDIPVSQPVSNRPRHVAPPRSNLNTESPSTRSCFSQPADVQSMLFSDSQGGQSQFIDGMDALTRLVRRMTRFCVLTDVALTIQRVLSVCASNGVVTTMKNANEIICQQRDIVFIVTVYTMSNTTCGAHKVMIDFRRSRGDGLEFKRLFRKMRPLFADIICIESTTWLESQGLMKSQLQ